MKLIATLILALSLPLAVSAQQPQQPPPNAEQQRIADHAGPLVVERDKLMKKLNATVFAEDVQLLLQLNEQIAKAQAEYAKAGEIKPPVAPVPAPKK